MTFKEYAEQVNKFLKEHPESADDLAIHAKDDEGNGYCQVNWGPGAGCFKDGEFSMEEGEFNAVCIN
jgi:hypothetical protein